MEVEAIQQFNGGIIFVSFVISTIGSMTTLELLRRRTHIRGRKNWYLLLSAALAMGSVGIWSMHFIGNNSLTLLFPDHTQAYQLAYSGGYTFASLVVSVACMFISFSFVGVTEHVQVYRIFLSGILAGLGIVLMHYLGQFAIEYFHVIYKAPYVVGAAIIACTAVIAALWIFFKLREQWMNQWYKRLGCALIMALAVCGMHYTAMVGTTYRDNGDGAPPPNPLLPTPVLIGVICAVVVIACLSLFYIGVKCSMERIAEISDKKKKRLVVDLVLFDGSGRILVDIDGHVPTEEVLSNLEFKTNRQEFSPNHPLFIRLFQVVSQWSTTPTLEDYDRYSHSDEFNIAERRFHEATSCLMESLQLENASELGLLYESVIKTHTIIQPSLFQQKSMAVKQRLRGMRHGLNTPRLADNATEYGDAYSLSETDLATPTTITNTTWHVDPKNNTSTSSFDQASSIEAIGRKKHSSSTMHLDFEQQLSSTPSNNPYHSSGLEGDEERHIVLVRQLTSDKDIHRFMTHGYRFANTTFIAKVMAAKLQVPNDYLLKHFRDMHLLAQSSLRLSGSTSPRVMVGLLGLVDEGQTYDDVQMVVDKHSRYGFPMVELVYQDTGETVRHLLPEEKHLVAYTLQDHSLQHMADIDKYVDIQSRTSTATGRTSTNTIRTTDATLSFSSSIGALSASTTVKTNTSANFSASNLDEELAIRQQYYQHNVITSPMSPISPSSTLINPTNTATITHRFAKAMESASQRLIKTIGKNGTHLGLSGATLQAEVLDLPAFALTTGPCTLILYRTCLRTIGTLAAIQQHTVTEPIGCIPLQLAPPLAFAITQRAADHYQTDMTNNKPSWGTELEQQMLYGTFAHQNASLQPYQQIPQDQQTIKHNRGHSDSINMGKWKRSSTIADLSLSTPDMMTSLPPPPRAKRSRRPFSLDASGTKQPPFIAALTATKLQSMNETEPNLIILSPKDRFFWLDQIIIECLHSAVT
ncbi:hypothetical protein BC941DRAFT_505014 [Chlamydoabsidia padenii]|nr:hypothetical protein BC941DRAFT_505014 [Chlamydoabsidia padenii]